MISNLMSVKFTRSLTLAGFLAIYFSSGFAALVYQVVWQRMLTFFSGADLLATTTIVASFMAGMGLGSVAGGAIADRVSVRWQIGLFAVAELLTGLFGLLSKWWYYDVLFTQFGHLASSPLALAGVLFLSLLVPTFLMGATLPLLSKALTPRVALAGRRIGLIYAINTLGAAAGALVTAWKLLGVFDFQQILQIGAALNAAIATLGLILGVFLWRNLVAVPAEPGDSGNSQNGSNGVFPAWKWMWIYSLSGIVALSLELIWFRLLGVMLKSNSFTFPHLLGIYLAGLAAGILIGTLLLEYVARPAPVFLILQSGITIYAGLSVAFLTWGLDRFAALAWLKTYLGGYNPLEISVKTMGLQSWFAWGGPYPNFFSLYILVPLALMVPPLLMMGMSFPFLQRAVHDDRAKLGRRVGWLQASNIAGSMLGAMLTGGILMEFFGTAATLRLLMGIGAVFVVLSIQVLFAKRSVSRRWATIGALIAVGCAISVVPSGPRLWAKLHGVEADLVIATEGGSGLSILKSESTHPSSTTWIYTNGLGQSWVPYPAISIIHSRLGAIPVLLHPRPVDIAVIGLGSGDTLFSAGGREETQRITCIEIVESGLRGLQTLQQKRPYAGLQSLLNDSRISYVFGDGRTYIGANDKKYDVIEADALRATSAFAGNLYSAEYFELIKGRLKPGGFAVTWAPTQRVLETFLKVFPHVMSFDSVMIGSLEPIPFDHDLIRSRLENSFTKAYYARAGIDLNGVILPFLANNTTELDKRQFGFLFLNSDLFPQDEYGR